ncbi:MAG: hypothetical protein IJ055_00175 [Oscillospiraceae bacterium]|nr:hypothetical protein [Oscillospiraceae bacterium]
METLLRHLTVYEKLRPRRLRTAALPLGLSLFALVLCSIGTVMLVTRTSPDTGFGMLFAGLVFLICIPFLARDSLRRYRLLEYRFRQLTAEDFLQLEAQLQNAPLLFGTLHCLRAHLFFPEDGLLIAYHELHAVRAEVHKTNLITTGVTLHLMIPGAHFRVAVRDHRSFLASPELLCRRMDAARRDPVPYTQTVTHSVHLPHIGT